MEKYLRNSQKSTTFAVAPSFEELHDSTSVSNHCNKSFINNNYETEIPSTTPLY